MTEPDLAAAWAALVDDLRTAGERVAASAAELDPLEQADAYRALVRALNNQLGRFEVDRDRPELVPFNGWREKFLMDNPDFSYWVADIRPDRRYRIVGNVGDAVYTSITAYAAGGVAQAAASARIDSDALAIGDDGSFSVLFVPESAGDDEIGAAAATAGEPRLRLPNAASAVWVRQFHDDAANDTLGWCRIEPLDDVPPPPVSEPGRLGHQLARLGQTMARFPRIVDAAVAPDLAAPNEVRHWAEMTGGAAFTEPAIHYVRGAWQLGEGEALVIDGVLPACRYWNVLLYSRHLNSLDFRHRRVSRTAASSTVLDGRYRFVIAATDPGVGDWLDSEGREFGIFVMRFLQPVSTPELPTVERLSISELTARGASDPGGGGGS